jgi:hypothetical protein
MTGNGMPGIPGMGMFPGMAGGVPGGLPGAMSKGEVRIDRNIE